MAQLLNRLSKALYKVGQELLDLFAINVDEDNYQAGTDVSDIDD